MIFILPTRFFNFFFHFFHFSHFPAIIFKKVSCVLWTQKCFSKKWARLSSNFINNSHWNYITKLQKELNPKYTVVLTKCLIINSHLWKLKQMIFQDNKPGIGYFRSYFFRPKQKYLSALKKKFQEVAGQNYICKFLSTVMESGWRLLFWGLQP